MEWVREYQYAVSRHTAEEEGNVYVFVVRPDAVVSAHSAAPNAREACAARV